MFKARDVSSLALDAALHAFEFHPHTLHRLRKMARGFCVARAFARRKKIMLLSRFMSRRLGTSSAIRQAFEKAEQLKERYGADNVFDFSIGNPTAPCPAGVRAALAETERASTPALHGYMDSAGYVEVRTAIAGSLAQRFGTPYTADDIIMTTGAACAINTLMQTVLDPDDEVITLLPSYPAYRVFVENWGAHLVEVPFDGETMLPDLAALERALSPRTKLVVVNTPNNPSGLVYPPAAADGIAAALARAERAFGHPVLLLSDEPYRDLVYDGVQNPWWPALYDNTVVVYSFSKSASIAGERIGYAALTPGMAEHDAIGAGIRRSLGDVGFVNAPATAQRMAAACADDVVDIAYYDRNRRVLAAGLAKAGFTFVSGNGAFYLLVAAPDGNEQLLLDRLADQRIIAVGGADFGAPGYVRLSYCLPPQAIARALPAFAQVARAYGLNPQPGEEPRVAPATQAACEGDAYSQPGVAAASALTHSTHAARGAC